MKDAYEKGSFFLPHRDGEKLDNMGATTNRSKPTIFRVTLLNSIPIGNFFIVLILLIEALIITQAR
jgi:hypothetical protein